MNSDLLLMIYSLAAIAPMLCYMPPVSRQKTTRRQKNVALKNNQQ
jgi:hypothetical protein